MKEAMFAADTQRAGRDAHLVQEIGRDVVSILEVVEVALCL